jgi:localization factor PodJL
MANAMPWSVRGIDPDIREQAVEAAHRSGLSVGQWLNQVLAGNLDEDDAYEEPARGRRRRPSRFDDLNDRLGRLASRGTLSAANRLAAADVEDSPVLDLIENAVRAIERLEGSKGHEGGKGRASVGSGETDERMIAMLRAFEKKLDALATGRADPREETRATTALRDPRLDRLLAELDRAQEPAQPLRRLGAAIRPSAEDAGLARALCEIEARRRNLDGDAARPDAPRANPATSDAPIDAMRAQLDDLVTRIDAMRSEQQPAATSLQDRLSELTSRIEGWRSEPQGEIAQLRQELAGLGAAIEELSPRRLAAVVEDAITRVTEKSGRHADTLPERLAEPLERMHEDVRAVLRDIATSRDDNRLAREVANIGRRLDQLPAADPARLEDIARETVAIRGLVGQAMNAQPIDGLMRQIEAMGHQIENFQRAPLPGDDRQILAAIEGIEGKVADLALGLKKLAKDAKPLPQIDAIAERLERIDRALDKAGGTPLAGLDELTGRLEKIGASLDKVAERPDPDGAGQAVLVGMLERLSTRFDEVQNAQGGSTSLDALHDEIANLARRIDMAGSGMAGLDGIERNFVDLFSQLDQARKDMREVAEVAASKAATEAVRNAPRDESSETLAAEGLLLIKRDLNDFKSAQSEAEKRTRGTLESLHSTLETLVSRLSDAERQERARPASAVAAPAMTASAKPSSTTAAPAMPAITMPAATAAPPLAVQRNPASMSPSPIAPSPALAGSDPADLPLEPGIEPGGAGEEVLSADPKTNFITAARRAAQAASERSQAALADEKAAKVAGRAGSIGKVTGFVNRNRKPILMCLAAIVISVAALKVMGNREPVLPAKAPISQPQVPLPKETPVAPTGEIKPDGERTGSTLGRPLPNEGQTLPPEAADKRPERLSETPAIRQTDPLTVGSISQEGGARPIQTGKAALADLVAVSNLKGQDELREAALAGKPEAIFEIGARFADGRGVARDAKLAARWFEQAAVPGHAPSQYRLASLYREGKEITRDSALAFQWFDRAAAQGHVLAMHNAAVLLAEGVHGAPDYAGAALWFKRAAEHGVKDSQFNIAILFARGLGVSQNLEESYYWFGVAALQGDPDAGKKRDEIAGRLSKEQLAKAQARVKGFKPNPPSVQANESAPWKGGARRT